MNQETPRSYARKDIEIIKNIEIGTQILNPYILQNIFLNVTFFLLGVEWESYHFSQVT